MDSVTCTKCAAKGPHYFIRTRRRWRCKCCDAEFSVTTDSPFAKRKLSFKKLLSLLFMFSGAPKGISANHVCGELGIAFRTAFQNLGKAREALCTKQDRSPMSGLIQIDGCHFCGKPRRPRKRSKYTSTIANNHLKSRKAGMVPGVPKSQIESWNREKLKNRRIVLSLCQLDPKEKGRKPGRTMTYVIETENSVSVIPIIQAKIVKGSIIQTDDGHAYTSLSAWYDHQSVRHSEEYSTPEGVNNNQAECFNSRMRRAEYGTYHGMRPQYVDFYAAESAWRQDCRRESRKQKFVSFMACIFTCDISFAFHGYCQGRHLKTSYLQ